MSMKREPFENIMAKGEIAHYEQFLLLPFATIVYRKSALPYQNVLYVTYMPFLYVLILHIEN